METALSLKFVAIQFKLFIVRLGENSISGCESIYILDEI